MLEPKIMPPSSLGSAAWKIECTGGGPTFEWGSSNSSGPDAGHSA